MAKKIDDKAKLKRVTFRLPDNLYDAIKQIAETETRPINSQAIVLLKEAISTRQSTTQPETR